ncbi:MAG TPA: TlpA disulfide reductase family protein [Polyangiales bacterium]|nr:TlpA disulfide reductase family protein [Polyangiales bacterium]
MKRRRARLILAFVLGLQACAARQSSSAPAPTLDLTLGRADGTTIEFAAISGRPTLLFLFATYDSASQFALAQLLKFVEHEPDLQVIGIALQPDAKAFLDLYKQSLSVPFALYYDPGNRLLRGGTVLGRVRAVPMLVALDADGGVRDQHFGVPSTDELRSLTDRALQR